MKTQTILNANILSISALAADGSITIVFTRPVVIHPMSGELFIFHGPTGALGAVVGPFTQPTPASVHGTITDLPYMNLGDQCVLYIPHDPQTLRVLNGGIVNDQFKPFGLAE